MFKDKEMPCEFKRKRKEIRMCDTSDFIIFSWCYLTDLCNCSRTVKPMILPTCLQGFDFRSFSCPTAMFIEMSHKSHIWHNQHCFGFIVLRSGRNLALCICHPVGYVQETSYSKAKYLERHCSQAVVQVTDIISCGFQT